VAAFEAWLNEKGVTVPSNPEWEALPGNLAPLKALATPEGEARAVDEADPLRATLQQALDFVWRSGGGNYIWRRFVDERGLDWLRLGLVAARVLDEPRGAGYCLNEMALWLRGRGYGRPALACYEAASRAYHELGDQKAEATTLNNIGAVYDDLGEKQRALAYYEQALPIDRAVGDRAGEAATLNNIGRVYDDLGEKQRALDYYQQALPIFRAVGDRAGEAITCFNMGMVYEDLGELERAIEYVARCVELKDAIGHPDLESDRAELARLKARRDGGAG
jgi:tetratricopeptide (TPR) repeat protein